VVTAHDASIGRDSFPQIAESRDHPGSHQVVEREDCRGSGFHDRAGCGSPVSEVRLERAQLDELYVAFRGPGAHRSGTVRGRPGRGGAAQEGEAAMTAIVYVVGDPLQGVGVVAYY